MGAYEPPLPWLEWWPRRSASSIAAEDPAAYAEGFFRRVVGDAGLGPPHRPGRADRQADGPALVAELSDLRAATAPFDLAELRAPLVLGRGGASVWHHRRAIDALVELVPGSEVIEIPGSAHGAPLSHPDAFAAFVRRVVQRATASASSPEGAERDCAHDRAASTSTSWGSPSTRSAMMLRCTSAVPPPMVSAREKR